jgi:hypothetical protein
MTLFLNKTPDLKIMKESPGYYLQAVQNGGYGGYYKPQSPKVGSGATGGAALGLGGGLIGGVLLEDAIQDHYQNEYGGYKMCGHDYVRASIPRKKYVLTCVVIKY